jgi:RNA polymerase sigma-54 factor
MSLLSPKLQLRVAQKQILTPGLVQMVTVLQLNRLELKEMLTAEMVKNPVLEESADAGEEVTAEELLPFLEPERVADPADREILDASVLSATSALDGSAADVAINGSVFADAEESAAVAATVEPEAAVAPDPLLETPAATDPFDEIDFGSFFDEYLDPGYKSPAAEPVDKPSFETFLSAPVTLGQHLREQLSVSVMDEAVRDAAESIIGNLDESGYVSASLEEIAAAGEHSAEDVEAALRVVQSLDPAGVGARNLRECLLLQIESVNGQGGVAWQIVSSHLRLLETRQYKEIAKVMGRPLDHIETAVAMIQHLNPQPGQRYSGAGARVVEPDVYFIKDAEDFIIQMNDEDVPQLRLNSQYKRMLDRNADATKEVTKEVREYVRERYASAIQLMKNIEQRKQTIMKVCQAIVRRQMEFLNNGIDQLKPMMIKEVAEEVGVHPSTVSRAVANKYVHTPQGVFELRYFFSEAVQGPSGGATPLLILKRKVKKMIDEEDKVKPLTDEQITAMLQREGIDVTRRTVAKYREDMKIPSTHQRRVRN